MPARQTVPSSRSPPRFVPNPEPALAGAIAEAVAAYRTRRVPLAVVLAAAASVDRTAASAVGWRARVRTALEELRDQGVVEWPATRFDTSSAPPLPTYVSRPSPLKSRPSQAPPVWHHELAWAAEAVDEGRLSSFEIRHLSRINEWLRRRTPFVVPLRERSLDIFGDEKILETLVLGPLFAPGRLGLELLACEPCWPPVEQTILGPGGWLIVENYTTYVSLTRRAAATGFDGRVVWGSGNQVATRLETLAAAGEHPVRMWYFGDIDAGGFRVAAGAERRTRMLDLGALRPARRLYRMALELGRPRPSENRASGEASANWTRRWLGGDLGESCAQITTAGQRIVQETVGTTQLADHVLAALLADD